jgi:Acyl-CoA dehydrogenase, C-terminal domain
VNFEVASELRHFGESVRAAVGSWEPSTEPELGAWLDDRDAALEARLEETGWSELWSSETGPIVAGGLELGRAIAPACVLDEATLGGALAVGGRIRHGANADVCAVPQPGWGLALAHPGADRSREPTLDGSGTVLAAFDELEPLPPDDAEARWSAWTAATLAYLAGLAGAALETTITHARNREQFGRPLASMPAVQARLADAALAADGLELMAWHAAVPSSSPSVDLTQRREAALLWAGGACRDLTATAHQVHGAVGFALETGLHRYYRRAKAVQVWVAVVCRECA